MNYAHNKRFECDQCHKKFNEKTRLTIHLRKDIQMFGLIFIFIVQFDNSIFGRIFIYFCLFHDYDEFLKLPDRLVTLVTLSLCNLPLKLQYWVSNCRTHTGEKPFVCDLCGFSCTQRNNLRKHKELRHPDGESKLFQCDICQAKFNTKGNLKRHKQRHSDLTVLPFVCETCGKNFKVDSILILWSFNNDLIMV